MQSPNPQMNTGANPNGAFAPQPGPSPINVVVQNTATANAPIVLAAQKSVFAALVLTFFFGPLGMFYSTLVGALVMLPVTILISIFTLGFGAFLAWPICMIWAAVAASSHNNRILTVRTA